ncbi:ABC transporter permease [Clostridiaceae bacterium HSG29]|nr:ABC transporter permease [Clostridiaceae bacterium HSG29]
MTNKNNEYEKEVDELSLDDEQRVKILSPWAMVFKRFIRNKLAITGSIFIFAMFLFSFVGGLITPYEEDQVFTKYDEMYKIFAGVSENDKFKYIVEDDKEFSLINQSNFILTVNSSKEYFESKDEMFVTEKIDDEYYIVNNANEVAIAMSIGKNINVSASDTSLTDDFNEMAKNSVKQNETFFEVNSKKYYAIHNRKNSVFYEIKELAVATKNIYSYSDKDIENNFLFCKNVEDAIYNQHKSFELDGNNYEVKLTNDGTEVFKNNEIYASLLKFQMEPIYEDVFIDLEFKKVIKNAIINNLNEFIYKDQNGNDAVYRLYRQNLQWTVEKQESTYLVDAYSAPSNKHWLGTDGHGMDLLTRLMYGGRISLRIGFIVVIIETFIGVILGGVAGYFGKFWDNLIMRIVDIFNCIPSLPLIIILGSVMDQLRVAPEVRLNVLMLVMAFLGWPGIARMVRGQTLFLREQEFMTATEATGLDVSKRIFKHLIPNIIPQLIVICTLSLGGVILMESVLSFLGVGVKFPFASWGNIINAVSNVFVMSSYLFVWIPAGMCILITVLGFNFIGDGLRDAFDPKMKR